MNKKSIIIAVVIVVLLIFISGAVETNKPESSGEYFTFTDSEGEIVELSHKPQKTAVLFSSLAECWIEAGGEVYVTVGESVERGLVKEETELVDKGAGKTVDTEKLISLEPDFVICSADIASHRDVASALKKAKIPVAMLRMDTFEDYLTILRTLTKITGKTENYEQFGENAKSEIEQIISGGKRENNPKILFVRSGSSYSSAKAKKADDNFAAKILEDLGCVNIADKAETLLDNLSAEVILKENPQYIFVSVMGDYDNSKAYMQELLAKKEYASLDAVKNGRVYFLPKELFQYKPCGRWAESYRYISSILNNE
ncbi:MAG: ABC transporter substrate-binding protein [Clostridia bacterium]|jgi:iron complex transport system substrate-binding protein|nr:ABC transporter substrate-binding protein [Clostridia bacterium]